jgi:hypothetical protein
METAGNSTINRTTLSKYIAAPGKIAANRNLPGSDLGTIRKCGILG